MLWQVFKKISVLWDEINVIRLVIKMYCYIIVYGFCVINWNTLFYKSGQIFNSLTRDIYIPKFASFQDGGILMLMCFPTIPWKKYLVCSLGLMFGWCCLIELRACMDHEWIIIIRIIYRIIIIRIMDYNNQSVCLKIIWWLIIGGLKWEICILSFLVW